MKLLRVVTVVVAAGAVQGAAFLPLTPTLSAGKVLYSAHWNKGLRGWTVSSPHQWKVAGGQLVGASKCSGDLLAPFDVSHVANYTLEVRLRALTPLKASGFDEFGLYPRVSFSKSEQEVSGVFAQVSQGFIAFLAGKDESWSGLTSGVPFAPGGAWHTYDVSVHATTFSAAVDGKPFVHTTSQSIAFFNRMATDKGSRFPAVVSKANRVGLFCGSVQVAVSSFRVLGR